MKIAHTQKCYFCDVRTLRGVPGRHGKNIPGRARASVVDRPEGQASQFVPGTIDSLTVRCLNTVWAFCVVEWDFYLDPVR